MFEPQMVTAWLGSLARGQTSCENDGLALDEEACPGLILLWGTKSSGGHYTPWDCSFGCTWNGTGHWQVLSLPHSGLTVWPAEEQRGDCLRPEPNTTRC